MKNISIKDNTKFYNLIKKVNTQNFTTLIFIIASLILFNLDRTNNYIITNLKSNILNVTIKLHVKTYFDLYINSIKPFLTKYENLRLENSKLAQQNSLLRQNILLMNMLNIENIKLKKLVNFISTINHIEYISTYILNVSDEFYHHAFIPLGYDHGIQYNQAIVNDQGLIGKIIKVEKNFSQILLITDKKFRIPAKTLKSNTDAIVAGCNKHYLKLLYLPEQNKIQDKEVLITSRNDNIPTGIHIGYIYEKDKVLINIDLKKIDLVSVIKVKE